MPLPRNPKGSSSSAGAIIADLVARRSWGDRLEQYVIFTRWAEIVGRDMANWAFPEYLRRDVLWLVVTDGGHALTMSYQKQTLLQQINQFLGSSKIRDIRFRLGDVPATTDRQTAQTAGVPRDDQDELHRLTKEITTCVGDAEIGRALARLRYALTREQRRD